MRTLRRSARGFTMIEVLLSVSLFAIAVVVLAGAYVNILEGMENIRTDRAFEQEVRWVRERILSEPDLKTVEEGGEAQTPDFGMAKWQVEIEPTNVADLFSLTMLVEMEGGEDQPLREVTETFLVLRPQWSEPVEKQKLRTEARSRIEEDRRHRGVLAPRGSQ